MLEGIIQYKVGTDGEQNGLTFECKTLPREGEYIQWRSDKAFLVERVYHIPKVINQESNEDKADFIVFGKFVDDLSVSDF